MTLEQLYTLQAQLREVTGYPARIVGGAVRDTILGGPIKDIDVVIASNRDEDDWAENARKTRWAAQLVADRLGLGHYQETSSTDSNKEGAPYPDDDGLYATYNIERGEGQPFINLLFVEDEEEFLNGFPDTISQVALNERYDTELSYDASPGFEHARLGLDSVYTRLEPDNPRVQRLSAKYPSLSWVSNKDVFDFEGHGAWA